MKTKWKGASFNDNLTVGDNFEFIASGSPDLRVQLSLRASQTKRITGKLSRRMSGSETSTLVYEERERARNEALDILEGRTVSKIGKKQGHISAHDVNGGIFTGLT